MKSTIVADRSVHKNNLQVGAPVPKKSVPKNDPQEYQFQVKLCYSENVTEYSSVCSIKKNLSAAKPPE